jgi:hypothetical protein
MQFVYAAHGSISLARLSARSISRLGVFWVFYTKTRTMTTRCRRGDVERREVLSLPENRRL